MQVAIAGINFVSGFLLVVGSYVMVRRFLLCDVSCLWQWQFHC